MEMGGRGIRVLLVCRDHNKSTVWKLIAVCFYHIIIITRRETCATSFPETSHKTGNAVFTEIPLNIIILKLMGHDLPIDLPDNTRIHQ